MIQNSKHHVLKDDISHLFPILLKSWNGLELVIGIHNRAKNQLGMSKLP